MRKKVAVIMGSDSDLETMKPCIARLKSFDIPVEVRASPMRPTFSAPTAPPPPPNSSPPPPRKTDSAPSLPPPGRPLTWPVFWRPTPLCP